MSNLSPGVRVTHANPERSYGAGVVQFVHPASPRCRRPSTGQVLFDGERCSRRVWLADLTSIVTPAPLRIVYPIERAGELVVA